MQATGLALATSIASFIYFLVLFIKFRVKLGSFDGILFLKNIFKYVIATTGVIPVFLLCEIFRNRLSLPIFVSISMMLSLFVYALILYLLKAELFIEALAQVKTFVKNCLQRKEYN
jgi:hypothetical protein